MKSALLLASLLLVSSFAQAQVQREPKEEVIRVNASSLHDNYRNSTLKDKLKNVSSCEEGYNLTRHKIDNLNPNGQAMAGIGMASYTIGFLVFGSSLGILVYPVGALYSTGLEIRQGHFANAEKVFLASRYCNEYECNYRPLVRMRKWLEKKHDISISNRELAELVNTSKEDLEFCTSRVEENGIRKMKTYKQLRESILEKLSV